MENQKNKFIKGFTLIEMIVVMAVFLFVIGAAITVFLNIFQQQRGVLAEQELLNQVSYAEEYMSKAMRTAQVDTNGSCVSAGYIYMLTHPTQPQGSVDTYYYGIKFLNQSDGTCEEFFLDTGGILKESKNGGSAVDLISSNLQFAPANPIRFSINGGDGSVHGQGCSGIEQSCGACNDSSKCGELGADSQPRVTMLLNIVVGGDNQEQKRVIQTTISQRDLNVKQ